MSLDHIQMLISIKSALVIKFSNPDTNYKGVCIKKLYKNIQNELNKRELINELPEVERPSSDIKADELIERLFYEFYEKRGRFHYLKQE